MGGSRSKRIQLGGMKLSSKQRDERQVDRLWACFNALRPGEYARIGMKDLYELHGLLMHEQDLQVPSMVAVGIGIEVGLEYAARFGVPDVKSTAANKAAFIAEVQGRVVADEERAAIGFKAVVEDA